MYIHMHIHVYISVYTIRPAALSIVKNNRDEKGSTIEEREARGVGADISVHG